MSNLSNIIQKASPSDLKEFVNKTSSENLAEITIQNNLDGNDVEKVLNSLTTGKTEADTESEQSLLNIQNGIAGKSELKAYLIKEINNYETQFTKMDEYIQIYNNLSPLNKINEVTVKMVTFMLEQKERSMSQHKTFKQLLDIIDNGIAE
jgi:hypothetical protein